jgi:hypothetical protein
MISFRKFHILYLIISAVMLLSGVSFSADNKAAVDLIPDSSAARIREVSIPGDTSLAPAVDTTVNTRSFLGAVEDSAWWARNIPNPAFGVGERLEFSVKYGTISAGIAVMEISDTASVDSHTCYRIVSTANSNDFISVFYKVRDSVQTYLDVPGLFPRIFSKHLREGNYKVDRLTYFDQKRHLAITGKDTIPTFGFVQDPLSSLYYIRTQELIPGNDVMLDSHADRQNFPLKVKVLGKEQVEVPAGKFDCVVIEPVMRSEGIFKAKGNIKIWLTDDEYKMPVMMKTEVYFLGSINAQLSKYTRGRILDGQVQKD